MDRTDKAKIVIVKNALGLMFEHGTEGWCTHKDLFHPSAWTDTEIADVAARKEWQKTVLGLLVMIKVIHPLEVDDGGKVIKAFKVVDPACARKMQGEEAAIWWLIAPKDVAPPDWILDRAPREPEPPADVGASEEDAFKGILDHIGKIMIELQASNRRIEDRINKFELKASESRDKALQLSVSTVSDMRQCVTEFRELIAQLVQVEQGSEQKREEFLDNVAENDQALSVSLRLQHKELIGALDLHRRYSDMVGQIQTFTLAIQSMRSAMEPVMNAASSLEAGVDTAMELARDIEEQRNATG